MRMIASDEKCFHSSPTYLSCSPPLTLIPPFPHLLCFMFFLFIYFHFVVVAVVGSTVRARLQRCPRRRKKCLWTCSISSACVLSVTCRSSPCSSAPPTGFERNEVWTEWWRQTVPVCFSYLLFLQVKPSDSPTRRTSDSPGKQPSADFPVFCALIPYMHRTGRVGARARDALLLCMELTRSRPEVGRYMVRSSSFCQVRKKCISILLGCFF